MNPKIVFMGTPEFAVPSLVALYEKYGISAVVTVPDKPQGRGLQMQPSAVKKKALEYDIPVLQPEKLKDEIFISELTNLEPDIIIVIAFRILPREVYTLPKLGSFNIHGSLLPKYRGAAPINHAILNGEKITGLTSFLLEQKVDTGSLLLTKELEIPEYATAGDLHDMLMPLAAELSLETADLLLTGNFAPKQQDESLATPAPKIFPDQCRIDFEKPSNDVISFIHGMSPYPGAWCMWNDLRLKILRVIKSNRTKSEPGHFCIYNKSIFVYCSDGTIELTEIQLQGKKAMKTSDFLMGYRGSEAGIFL